MISWRCSSGKPSSWFSGANCILKTLSSNCVHGGVHDNFRACMHVFFAQRVHELAFVHVHVHVHGPSSQERAIGNKVLLGKNLETLCH